ncbi:hypothetical protein WOLCODRAFT_158723 [Wolfiporia cocos MD-104 SS10]|uniref:Retrotransposon gag domain-containing protein n=1 Tax=Wolfiporia cocos (strain MD-104) TaxID=742152 RepID=A0A2H3JR92_WOLCO|nr:hypothetical protein WOLCODRAFT_158723 [Wolfiporia cocos MD-104 SS10]
MFCVIKLGYWDEDRVSDYIHGAVGLQHRTKEEERRKNQELKELDEDSDTPSPSKRMTALAPSPKTRAGYVPLKPEHAAYNEEFNLLQVKGLRSVPPKWQIPQVSDKRRETFTPIPGVRDPPTYTTNSQRRMVKEPPIFDDDKVKFRDWWMRMVQYLASQRQYMETSHDKIESAMSYIRGEKVDQWFANMFTTYFNKETGWWEIHFDHFKQELFTRFEDPDREKRAWRQLTSLKMVFGKSNEYFTEIETLCREAGVNTDNEFVLQAIEKNVPSSVYEPVYASFSTACNWNRRKIPVPKRYQPWKEAVMDFDQALWRRAQECAEERKNEESKGKGKDKKKETNTSTPKKTYDTVTEMRQWVFNCHPSVSNSRL